MRIPGLRTWVIFYLLSFVGILWAAFLTVEGVMLWVSLMLVIVVVGVNFVTVYSEVKRHASRRELMSSFTVNVGKEEEEEGEGKEKGKEEKEKGTDKEEEKGKEKEKGNVTGEEKGKVNVKNTEEKGKEKEKGNVTGEEKRKVNAKGKTGDQKKH